MGPIMVKQRRFGAGTMAFPDEVNARFSRKKPAIPAPSAVLGAKG
jgi:hypothetical protein